MNKLVLVAPLLLAALAYEKVAELLSPPSPTHVAAPAAAPRSTAAASGVQATAAVRDVVNAANAFIATLSAAQQATLLQSYSQANVTRWSNLPTNLYTNRLGLRLADLTAAQRAAALAVVQAATGTTAPEGFHEIQQIRAADDNLLANGGGAGFGSNLDLIVFLGTPSATGTWQLHFGGHHMATNVTMSNGRFTGHTPKFEASEPVSFTTANADIFPTGTVITPLASETSAVVAMLNGLTATQKSTALLTQTFNNIVLGAQRDGQFPATKVGLPVSQLSAAQQQLVMAAMAPWVQDAENASATSLLATYQSQLADTYIAYSGTGCFTTRGDYARIDGPNVWIEVSTQNAIVYKGQIHYHTIWRDRARDYGGNFYTTVTATKEAAASQTFSVSPISTAGSRGLRVKLTKPATTASYTLRNGLNQTITTKTFTGDAVQVSTEGLAPGPYVLSMEADGQEPVTHRFMVK